MKPIYWVVIGLAAVIVLMILFDRDPEPVNTQPWKDTIAKVNEQLSDSSARIQSLLKENKELKVEHRAEKESFVGQINGLKTRLAQKRVKIDTLILDNPELAEYVAVADSTIEVQTARIETLEFQYDKLEVNMEAVVLNFEEQIKLHEQKFEAQKELTKDYQKQARKERRKATLFKVTTVVGTVGAFLLSSQL